ncbi:hypothetical protein BKA65DRAFT_131209 [Rhexocercosporidium sp. MPI-PUGE-AT-0058]|nr:hypothetical protein BKA65DRAFT_131209 [Rhexocercosporidium sp. MPI-PUGE-AT-0058]
MASPPNPTIMSSASSSSSSVHEEGGGGGGGTHPHPQPADTQTKRPRLHSRKSSGTIIVPREHPRVELKEGDEVFDEDDARAMSPRRSSQDLEKMSEDAKVQLNEHAKILQKSLLEIFNRIEAVKEEHDKLDSNNKFLQKYIGDLMSTSKITATGAAGGRKK